MSGVLSVLSVADESGSAEPIVPSVPSVLGAAAPLPMLDDEPELGGDYLDRVLDGDWDDLEGLDLRDLFR